MYLGHGDSEVLDVTQARQVLTVAYHRQTHTRPSTVRPAIRFQPPLPCGT